jgi:hypothetical protein
MGCGDHLHCKAGVSATGDDLRARAFLPTIGSALQGPWTTCPGGEGVSLKGLSPVSRNRIWMLGYWRLDLT